jgi:hypothetical protein
LHELRHVVAPAPAARLARDRQARHANVGQGEGAPFRGIGSIVILRLVEIEAKRLP